MCEVDVRDPGQFTLHVGISWFFGMQGPNTEPVARCTGVLASHLYELSDFTRSLVHEGRPIGVELSEEDAKVGEKLPRFGTHKCDTGDHPGRWVGLKDTQPCAPPYCTGNRSETIHKGDMVSLRMTGALECVSY